MTHRFKLCAFRRQKVGQTLRKSVATLLVKVLHRNYTSRRTDKSPTPTATGIVVSGRKYVTSSEHARFLAEAAKLPDARRVFCLLLAWSGARISEVLAVAPSAIDLESGTVSFETLKRRRRGIIRRIPLPLDLLTELDFVFGIRERQRTGQGMSERLWPWSRTKAWRCVKAVMNKAEVTRTASMPKGLRHGFGVAAFATVPPHLVQRWMGHASLRTTAIYGDVTGPEERRLAERLWRGWGAE